MTSGFGTGREREAQIDSLIHDLRTHELDESVSRPGRSGFAEDVDRIHDWARSDIEAQGIHGPDRARRLRSEAESSVPVGIRSVSREAIG